MVGKRSSKPGGYKGLPPYAPHSSWRELMDGLRSNVPARVDSSYLKRYQFSPSTQSMLQGALRFLGLIDNEMVPTPTLNELLKTRGEEYRNRLKGVVEGSYGPLLGDLDLSTVTPDMLRERFKGADARSDVARKCLSFFAAVAEEAGIAISPHVRRRRRQRTGPGPVRRSSVPRGPSKAVAASPTESPLQAEGAEGTSPSSLALVLEKFPAYDPGWDPETAAQWRESISFLLTSLRQAQYRHHER